MASAKDTFEGNTFAGNTFACGTWRGTGAAIAATLVGLWSNVLTIHANRDSQTIAANRSPVRIAADRTTEGQA